MLYINVPRKLVWNHYLWCYRLFLKLLTSLFSCDNYTGAVMQRSITVLHKYLVLHRSEAQPVELSFVITIQDVSILALIHITPHISLLFI